MLPLPNPSRDRADWPALTGVRALAALAVLGMHVHVLVTPLPLLKLGHFGVDVFFVLSGFLLTLRYGRIQGQPDADARVEWWPFMRQRLVRILPAFYVQVLILGLLAGLGAYAWPGWRQFLGQFTLAFYVGTEPLQAWVAPWWSLPVELCFYVLFPLTLWCLRRRPVPMLLIGLGLVYAYRSVMMVSAPAHPWLAFWLQQAPGRFDEFLIGMAAAWWLRSRAATGQDSGKWWFWLGLAAFAVLLSTPNLSQLVVHLGFGVCFYSALAASIAVMLVGLVLGTGLMNRLLAQPWLVWLGQISFGVYLWHYPLIEWVRRPEAQAWPGSVRLVLVLIGSLVLADLSWRCIERPALNWLRRRRTLG
ncbi:hypothetical protein C7S18_13045 [Ahniella affigens]|uniref:Acyltransferase 3 domain-containing protein n=1 Tax=Ahniella affigens TaxID=2021234 RepID=A0A2P1PTA4_9GAMM|nr:acyltransferase [Ahniella affigens]AVP98068.1 hypothetical protein C7S18_13045 [Ahniella affigens]